MFPPHVSFLTQVTGSHHEVPPGDAVQDRGSSMATWFKQQLGYCRLAQLSAPRKHQFLKHVTLVQQSQPKIPQCLPGEKPCLLTRSFCIVFTSPTQCMWKNKHFLLFLQIMYLLQSISRPPLPRAHSDLPPLSPAQRLHRKVLCPTPNIASLKPY